MTVVVDATVVVAALIDAGEDGQWAESIIAGGSLAAPVVVLVESANVLRRLERGPFASRVWELRHNVSSYDAWYVALAEALGSKVATLDRRLCRANGPTCEFLTRPDSSNT